MQDRGRMELPLLNSEPGAQLQADVDELRASIAEARSVLQQIRVEPREPLRATPAATSSFSR